VDIVGDPLEGWTLVEQDDVLLIGRKAGSVREAEDVLAVIEGYDDGVLSPLHPLC